MKQVYDEGIKERERYTQSEIDTGYIDQAIAYVIKQIDRKLEAFTEVFPGPTTENLVYMPGPNVGWTTSFWTGMLWLAYEVTGEAKYRACAEIHVNSFIERIQQRSDIETHDLGFLYTLSCVAAYRLTGNDAAKQGALEAADRLMDRYWEQAGIIQAWGNLQDPKQQGRIIIDCTNNLPLLYWASEVTGEPRYAEAAVKHVEQTARHIVREDASTYHTFYFDVATGQPRFGRTSGGYSDESCWARGQAWGIAGLPLTYSYQHDEQYLHLSKKLANYFLNRLPVDQVPYWDLSLNGAGVPRDSSAAAIAATGILEMSRHLPLSDPDKRAYEGAAIAIVRSLTDSYTAAQEPSCTGVLLHAVYSVPQNMGVDECNLWGDYYYFEALVRLRRDWCMYW
ncbi:glycoside hydrolase family 88 protein [Paenibacillus sp. LjRoot56]|uniref:glycoside hydrolase family 88 protein n=1 Tax=Paenibacillus sp. LjRoot56 TaxID=3342333 RepID=UPI003ED06192